MIYKIDLSAVVDKLVVDVDENLVLIDYFDPIFKIFEEEEAKNIFLIRNNGEVIWKIQDTCMNGGFVSIIYEDGLYYAIGFDTGKYLINIDTGNIKPIALLK